VVGKEAGVAVMSGLFLVDDATLALLDQAGVYVLSDKGKVRYVGQSNCLMARLSNHSPSQYDVCVFPTGPRESVYSAGGVFNAEAYRRLEARLELEFKLIKQLKPTDNIRK